MFEADFNLWEEEQTVNSEGLIAVQQTLDLAQELQYSLVTVPPKMRKSLGIEALELLNGHPNELKHHQFAFNVHHSYLNVHPNSTDREGRTSKYGSMRVLGQVGLYGLDRFDDSGWLITLQLFDPKQLTVANERDRLPRRLPAPLKLPVAAIELPVVLIK